MSEKNSRLRVTGGGTSGSLPKHGGKKSNKRSNAVNNNSSSIGGSTGQSSSKRSAGHIGGGGRKMTSLSPGTGFQRQGRQARSSSVNLKQQPIMLHQRTSKKDKRSMSSDRRGVGNESSSRNRRSSHSPLTGSGSKKKGSPGGQSVERGRDHKTDRDRLGTTRESNKNSYTSTTGAGGAGRDRDLRRSDLGNTSAASIGKDYLGREEKSDNRNRDFRGNERFDQRGKFGRELSKEHNKDQWGDNSRGEGNRGVDRRSNERANTGSSFEQRREGQNSADRDRRGGDRVAIQRDSEKNRAGYDRTPPIGLRGQRDDWNRSPVGDRTGNSGDRSRDNWDDGGNIWNRDRGMSPLGRRGGGRPRGGGNNTVLSGANSVPVKTDQSQGSQRRGKSPFGGRERSGRSRSRDRLLPPQALNRPSGATGDNRDNNREDRRSGHERDRSPRIDRNVRSSGDHFDRRRSSPRDGNRGSLDRLPPRRDRERGSDSFDDRHHDKDRHKDSVGSINLLSRMDRSRSREARIADKFSEEGSSKGLRPLDEGNINDNADNSSSDKLNKSSETSKPTHTLPSPNRKSSVSPSHRSYEKRASCDLKGGTNDQQQEIGGDPGTNKMDTQEYSDFDSDSGEEWLNDMRLEGGETEETNNGTNDTDNNKASDKLTEDRGADGQEVTNPSEDYGNDISDKIRKRAGKHDGLLEGISDEDLDDVSDEEHGQKGQSAKLADALGVDWSKLVELQRKQKTTGTDEELLQQPGNEADEKQAQAEARRKRWTPIAIFNRIGLPRTYLSDTFYNSFVHKLNETAQDGEKLELLHENAGFHVRLKEMRERRKNLFVNGPYSRPMLARQEIAVRRELCGLPDEDFCEVPLRPNTDMEIWNKAVQLLKGKGATSSSSTLPESNICSKTTPVHG